jgi:hypothetical protein
LGQVADDCAWESWLDNHAQMADLPPMKPRHGRAGVSEFFAYVATMQIQDFQVLDMLASDRPMVVWVRSRSRPTGWVATHAGCPGSDPASNALRLPCADVRPAAIGIPACAHHRRRGGRHVKRGRTASVIPPSHRGLPSSPGHRFPSFP